MPVILLAQEGMSNHSIANNSACRADGDRRPRRVWHRRGTGADREADAEPPAPDADTRGGEEDSGYHAQNQAADATSGRCERSPNTCVCRA